MADRLPTRGGACTKIIAARYVFAVLGSVAMAIIYGLKVNLSVAIVSMVNHSAINQHSIQPVNGSLTMPILNSSVTVSDNIAPVMALQTDDCNTKQGNDSQDAPEDGPFAWPGSVQGALKSSYFWGYIVAQIPGGQIAERFSAKWVMFFSVAINVVATILSPIAAKCHYGVFLVMRIAEGIGGGVTFPAMHVMLASWAPPSERSVMSSIVYAGTALGTVIFTLITGLIASGLGWEAIFYIEGSVAAIWLILWFILIADTPDKQTLISQEEREFITSSLNTAGGGGHDAQGKKPSVPWKKVFTSPAFLAILVAHTCSNWGWYMVLIELPHYMKDVLNLKIAQNAVLSAVPFFTMWLFSMILSKTLDTLRSKQIITTTTARKTATLIACVVPMICFIALCYIGCMPTLAIVLMTLAVTSVGGMFCGFLSNHIDIAPNFAGSLMAITNSCATIPGIIVPIFVGKLTEADPSIASWRIVFWVTIVLYIIEIIVYGIFASGEEQKWNRYDDTAAGEAQPLRATK